MTPVASAARAERYELRQYVDQYAMSRRSGDYRVISTHRTREAAARALDAYTHGAWYWRDGRRTRDTMVCVLTAAVVSVGPDCG